MKVLNLLTTGNPGGIETLCKNISSNKSSIDNFWMFIFSGGMIADEMKKEHDEKVIILNEKRNFFKIINIITKFCKENNIDAISIHHEGIYTNLIYITLKKKNRNIKFVRYLHSCFEMNIAQMSRFKKKIYKILLQKAIDISDLLIGVSNAVKESYNKNLNLRNKKVEVIYNGINNSFFEKLPPKEKNEKTSNTNLIYVGRLEKEKGVDLLIDALPLVKLKHNINLFIVGDGSELENLKQKCVTNNISDIVNFTGKQLDVVKWLDNSSLFIYPTICEEAFGISVVEAMARGVVPITFKKGGLTEIINSGVNGYLVNEVNRESLAQKIIEVLNYNLIEIRKNAIETAHKFSITNTITNLEKILKNM